MFVHAFDYMCLKVLTDIYSVWFEIIYLLFVVSLLSTVIDIYLYFTTDLAVIMKSVLVLNEEDVNVVAVFVL